MTLTTTLRTTTPGDGTLRGAHDRAATSPTIERGLRGTHR